MPKRPPTIVATDIASMRYQINEAFTEFSDYIEEICGIDGKQFKSHNDIDLNSHAIVNVKTPSASGDVASKAYVDATVGSPGVKVVAETSYGQTSKVGSSEKWAHEDHSHGTPAVPALDDLSDVSTSTAAQGDLLYFNGSAWVPVRAEVRLASIASINAKTVATTTLYTVPTGKSLIVASVFIRCTTLTGAKSVNANASIGSNATDYDDFLAATDCVFTASSTVLRYANNTLATAYPVYAAGTVLKLNIATGSDAATAETWTVDLFGYLL